MAEKMSKLLSMPLRFRVWDKVSQRFLSRRQPDGVNIEFSIFEMPLDIDCLEDDEKAQYIISQDTGLKDKNGKSIYTGDIVRWPISTNKKQYHYVSIVYRDGKVMYDHGSDFGSPISRYEEVALIFEDELVGNIWQNPELVETE